MDVLNAQLIHASSAENKAAHTTIMDDVHIGYCRLAASKLK
jgi:hypothetical protein